MSARAATRLVLLCVAHGLFVALVMSALDPLAVAALERLARH